MQLPKNFLTFSFFLHSRVTRQIDKCKFIKIKSLKTILLMLRFSSVNGQTHIVEMQKRIQVVYFC